MKVLIFNTFMLVSFLVLVSLELNAQFVTIPDANLAAWFNETYPTCISGNSLDTTCLLIEQETIVVVNALDISDLTGIQYFSNLTHLDCSSNNLISLPNLPSTIQTLLCNINQLNNLPELPSSLDLLDCSFNNISNIPALPSTLTNFACTNNQLFSLPELPDNLAYFYCQSNLLTTLPSLPSALVDFNCNNNQLSAIPTLPQTVQILYCAHNLLDTLPDLSLALQTLDCTSNQLTELPVLPATTAVLICDSNQLVALPGIPPLVFAIYCNNNQLTSLPELPQLQWLQCSNNNISCFPIFPESIGFSPVNFDISNNPATCLPNYIPAMGAELLSIPLCTISNSNGCEGSGDIGITGKVFVDVNGNCSVDAEDSLQNNVQIKRYNQLLDEYAITNSSLNGVYQFSEIGGNYIISIDTLNKPYQVNCSYPGTDTLVIVSESEPLATEVNFEIGCKETLDLSIQSINHQDGLIFPGQQHTLQVRLGDASQWYGLSCANGASAQVLITVEGPVSYAGAAPNALIPQVNGTSYMYEIADFGQIVNGIDFGLLFNTDTTAQNADQICVFAEIIPNQTDYLPANNTLEYCYSVVNSYDPNYKEVYPLDVLPGFEDYFIYTVHFQNLGTAPAINIRVLDTLDSHLDYNSFEVINYSHFNTATLANGIVNFRFPDIFLPDSLSNPEGSQGFVQYKIKPLPNLLAGTEIENTAHIFFDYNPAVITNTTVNNYVNVLSSVDSNGSLHLSVYPNPSSGEIFITGIYEDLSYSLVISDLSGRILKREQVSGKNQIQLILGDLNSGVYFLTASTEFTSKTVRFILDK